MLEISHQMHYRVALMSLSLNDFSISNLIFPIFNGHKFCESGHILIYTSRSSCDQRVM